MEYLCYKAGFQTIVLISLSIDDFVCDRRLIHIMIKLYVEVKISEL